MTIMANKTQVVIENEEDWEDDSNEEEEEIVEEVVEADDESDAAMDDSDLDGENKNACWADAVAKILKTNKPKNKKTLVLSRAKKINDVRKDKPKPAGFQVETVEGEIKEEQVPADQVSEKLSKKHELLKKKKKDILSLRKKPNILEKDRERLLMKIATKGVVQLFNAVKGQQKDIKLKLKEAGPLEVRRDKVLKSIDKKSFLDVLMGEKSNTVDETLATKNVKKIEKESEGATWNVLRDDFMMGAKMKDWDKELEGESEEEREEEENMESE